MGSDAEKIVDLYERHAAAWVAARLRQARFDEREWLERFCALAGDVAGLPLLDLGCGAGAPMAAYLAGRGYAVTGVDGAPAMVALFRQRLPTQQAVVADMRTLALPRRFGGILAWDSFFHLNHADQRAMFAVFRAHAAAGAALMFSSGPAHGEALGRLEGEALYHASLDADEYRQLLDAHGFDTLRMVARDARCGGRTVWLARAR